LGVPTSVSELMEDMRIPFLGHLQFLPVRVDEVVAVQGA
jgi:hypothetical protein